MTIPFSLWVLFVCTFPTTFFSVCLSVLFSCSYLLLNESRTRMAEKNNSPENLIKDDASDGESDTSIRPEARSRIPSSPSRMNTTPGLILRKNKYRMYGRKDRDMNPWEMNTSLSSSLSCLPNRTRVTGEHVTCSLDSDFIHLEFLDVSSFFSSFRKIRWNDLNWNMQKTLLPQNLITSYNSSHVILSTKLVFSLQNLHMYPNGNREEQRRLIPYSLSFILCFHLTNYHDNGYFNTRKNRWSTHHFPKTEENGWVFLQMQKHHCLLSCPRRRLLLLTFFSQWNIEH